MIHTEVAANKNCGAFPPRSFKLRDLDDKLSSGCAVMSEEGEVGSCQKGFPKGLSQMTTCLGLDICLFKR